MPFEPEKHQGACTCLECVGKPKSEPLRVDPLVSRSAAKLSEKAWRVGFACSRLLETLSADERQRVARQLLRSADEAED